MLQTRTSAFLSLLLVFLSGAVVGGFAYRVYSPPASTSFAPPRPSPEEARKHRMAELRERVKMDDQQLNQVQQIFDQTKDQFDALHKKMNEAGHVIWDDQNAKINAILRPDQLPLFAQLQAEHEAARKQHKKQEEEKGKRDRP
jgi:hypothetical protein